MRWGLLSRSLAGSRSRPVANRPSIRPESLVARAFRLRVRRASRSVMKLVVKRRHHPLPGTVIQPLPQWRTPTSQFLYQNLAPRFSLGERFLRKICALYSRTQARPVPCRCQCAATLSPRGRGLGCGRALIAAPLLLEFRDRRHNPLPRQATLNQAMAVSGEIPASGQTAVSHEPGRRPVLQFLAREQRFPCRRNPQAPGWCRPKG